MISEIDITAALLTFKLAGVTTVILLLLGTPLAWWLSHTKSRVKVLLEAAIALPLVLPPTVIGFYLLVVLGNNGPLSLIGIETSLAFTFTGIVIGSVIYSLPFVVQPLLNAFRSIPIRRLETAAMLGASPLDRFFSIAIPASRNGFLTAMILGFAHTLGEFGVVLMIGGNIPGETQLLSISIYDHVESMEYAQAHILSGGLLCLSFLLLIFIYILNHRKNNPSQKSGKMT